MADELIIDGDLIDLTGVGVKADGVIEHIQRIEAAIQKINSNPISLGSVNGMKELRDATDQLTKATQVLVDAVNKVGTARRSTSQAETTAVKTANDSAAATKKQSDALADLSNKYKDAERNAKNLAIEYGALDERTQAAAKSAADLKAQLVAANSVVKNVGNPNLQLRANEGRAGSNIGEINAERDASLTAAEAVNELDRAEAENENTATSWGDTQKIVAKSTAEITETFSALTGRFDEYTGTITQNMLAQKENVEALRANKLEQKEIEANIQKSGAATQAQANRITVLKDEEIKLTQINKELTSTINLQSKALTSEAGSAVQLEAELSLLLQSYSRLSAVDKASPFGQGMKKQIDILGPQVKAMDAEVGKFQKNVGNYGGAITKAFSSAFGYIRQIAYVLPGVGIAGILGAVSDVVIDLVGSLFKGTKALTEFKEKYNDLSAAVSSTDFKKAVTNVNELTINVGLAKQGFLDKNEVLKQYNDSIGKTTGVVGTLDEAEKALVKNGPAYIQMMLLKAAANLALEDAAKKAVDIEKTRLKELDDFKKTITDTRVTSGGAGGFGTGAFNAAEYDRETERIKAAQAKRQAQQIAIDEKAKKQSLDIATKFQEQAAKIAKDNKFDFFGGTEDHKTDVNKAVEEMIKARYDMLERSRKAIFELNKLEIQDEINKQKTIAAAGLDFISPQAREKQLSEEKRLVDLETNYELHANDLKIASINAVRNAKLSNSKLTPAQIGDINATAEKEIAAAQLTSDEIQLIRRKANDKIVQLESTAAIDIIAIRKRIADSDKELAAISIGNIQAGEERKQKERIEAEEKSLTTQQRNIQQAADERLTTLNNEYAAGKISKKQYEDEKVKIENDALKKSLQEQIAFYTFLVGLYEFDVDKKKEALSKIAGLQKQLSGVGLGLDSQKTKDQANEIIGIANQLNTTLFDFMSLGSQNRINLIQNEQDKLEERYRREIELINQTVPAGALRDQKLLEAEKRNQAARAVLDVKERQEKIRKAQADKAAAIFSITINTAKAIVADLGDPLKIVFDSIVGAAQLAIAIATPLPRFFRGKNDGYEGYGWVDDGANGLGNAPETIVRADGSIEHGGNRPRLTWLGKNDIVLPNSKDIAWQATASIPGMVNSKAQDELKNELKYGFRNTVKAIKAMPGARLIMPDPLSIWMNQKPWKG